MTDTPHPVCLKALTRLNPLCARYTDQYGNNQSRSNTTIYCVIRQWYSYRDAQSNVIHVAHKTVDSGPQWILLQGDVFQASWPDLKEHDQNAPFTTPFIRT